MGSAPRPGSLWILLALALATAGCVGLDVANHVQPDASSTAENAGESTDASASAIDAHTLSLVAHVPSEQARIVAVEDVEVSPTPQPIRSFQIGPEQASGPGTVLASFNVTDGARLDAFELVLTVHDGLGPAELVLQVPAWTALEDGRVNVQLELVEVGDVGIDRVDGDLAVQVPESQAEPRYGYLLWPQGIRQPLEGIDRIVSVPDEYPRFDELAEPVFTVDEAVTWTLDGEQVEEGTELRLAPGPGKHTLQLAEPDENGQAAELTFSLNDWFETEGMILAGSGPHRDSVAGANEDSYNVTIHEGVSSLIAELKPIGNETDIENLDIYALNETGGVVDQSTRNGTQELLTLSRSELSRLNGTVQLRVHGDVAIATEYKLSAKTFYRPW